MSLLLALLFAATALLYASVGFGGGSTYNALLVLAETDYRVLPSIALCCNIVVVTGGVWRFARAGHIPWLRVLPLVLLSVPMAWIGGRIVVPETVWLRPAASEGSASPSSVPTNVTFALTDSSASASVLSPSMVSVLSKLSPAESVPLSNTAAPVSTLT